MAVLVVGKFGRAQICLVDRLRAKGFSVISVPTCTAAFNELQQLKTLRLAVIDRSLQNKKRNELLSHIGWHDRFKNVPVWVVSPVCRRTGAALLESDEGGIER